jgi:hypothetical protein
MDCQLDPTMEPRYNKSRKKRNVRFPSISSYAILVLLVKIYRDDYLLPVNESYWFAYYLKTSNNQIFSSECHSLHISVYSCYKLRAGILKEKVNNTLAPNFNDNVYEHNMLIRSM